MINLHIIEQGTYVKIDLNQIVIRKNNQILKEIPIKNIESITVVGNVFLTTQTISQLVKLKIPISYLSTKGFYKFSIRGEYNVDINRQEIQFDAFRDEEFSLNLAKKIVINKSKNQLLVLRRYNRNEQSSKIENNIKLIKSNIKLINKSKNKQELLGVEGIISKYYFSSFKYLIPKEFKFSKRISYPSIDPINALLSFGYTLLLNLFINCLENKKLNPYKGFYHTDKIGHPALASDLMEEYRPIIVDSLVLNLIRRNIIKLNDFNKPDDMDIYFVNNEKIKVFIEKFNDKINEEKEYIKKYKTNTKTIIYMQISSIIEAMSNLNENLYLDVIYR